jgi:hypothetical protein
MEVHVRGDGTAVYQRYTTLGTPPKVYVRVYQSGAWGAWVQIGAVTSDNISAGALDGFVITGATFRTAESGARVVFDSSGLKAYDSSGTVVTTIDSSTGAITSANGTITGGTITDSAITGATFRTAESGARVVFDSSGLKAYDSSGTVVTTIDSSTGAITSANGTITGGTITDSAITNGSFTVDPGTGANYGKTAINGNGVTTSIDATTSHGVGSVQSMVKNAVGNSSSPNGALYFPELYLRQTNTSGGLWKTWYGNGYVETYGTDFKINPTGSIYLNALSYFSSNIWAKPSTLPGATIISATETIDLEGVAHHIAYATRTW